MHQRPSRSSHRSLLRALAFLPVALASGCGAQQRPDGGSGYLPVRTQVPNLTSADHNGQSVQLRADKVTLLYFYPRSGTPGCTKEACAFRDSWEGYLAAGVRVIGVSSDPSERQKKFAEEHQLPFPLVSDPDHIWSDAFGVNSFLSFDSRVSFLIDSEARVAKVYVDVDPGVHAQEVIQDVKQLGLQ